MVLTAVESRKARRKEERRAKKKSKRPRDGVHVQRDDPPSSERQHIKKAKLQKKRRDREQSNRPVRSEKSHVSKHKDEDPYANLDPNVAAAMRNDDAEIAELESKLGLGHEKERKRLYREYAKLEGYGDDFGDFLDELDNLTDRVTGKQTHEDLEYDDDDVNGNNTIDSGYYSSSDGEEVVPMKNYSAEEFHEEDSLDDNAEEDASDKSDDDKNTSDSSDTESDSELSQQSGGGEQEELENADHDVKDTYGPSEGEDIYGHTKGPSKSGQAPTKYVPPHLRANLQEDNPDRIDALRSLERSLNNVLNRLSEDTLISVAQSISKLYPSHPTSDVNDCLWKNLRNACVAKPFVMSGLIPVYVACMVGVHFQTGDQVQLGGHLLEKVVTELWKELGTARNGQTDSSSTDNDEFVSKEASNLALVLCYLYNYGTVHCTFLYDVIRALIKHFSELDVEILLLLLSHCGYSLRSDDPLALKEIVLLVQDRAVQAQTKDSDNVVASSSRVQYMISAMTDIKNNKKSKQDKALGEKTAKLRKLLGRIKSTVAANGVVRISDSSLRITLEDVLNVETKGRWWKVGASWVGNQMQHNDDEDSSDNGGDEQTSPVKENVQDLQASDDKLLHLASKLRMNTDIRRSIFCIIMGSEDCNDSFEKLVRAGMLKNQTERDTVRVLMECCGNEKSYNPFYSHLASRICDYQPQCKFTFQLAFWDIFKQFDTITMRKAANLAKLLFHLVAVDHSLKLSILKVIDMSPDGMPETAVIFLTIFFSSVFDTFQDPIQVKELFARGIPRRGSVPMGQQESDEQNDGGEGLRESLSVFFLQTLKSSPKNKRKSQFRANFKAAVKACETDGLDLMMSM